MQRGESNGIAMTKQTVNGKVRVLQSGRETSSKNRERERGREPPKGIQLQQTTTTTDSGGVLLGLILGINHTNTSAPHTIT